MDEWLDDWMLIAFDSTQQALRAEMLLEFAEIEIDLFPTPERDHSGLCSLYSVSQRRSGESEADHS